MTTSNQPPNSAENGELLGAHWNGTHTRFTVLSNHATAVHLCLFDDAANPVESRRAALRREAEGLWSTEVDDAPPGTLYAYRVDGPWAPRDGHRFNPAKLLVDPLAREMTGEPRDDPSLYPFELSARHPELTFNGADSAVAMPRSIVVDPASLGDAAPSEHADSKPIDERPQTPWNDTVIYEAHVRGLTRLHPDVPENLRGTYPGLAAPVMIDHFLDLGVTAIELLPVQQIATEPFLQRRGLRNYWGYSPLGFCAPHAGYAAPPDAGYGSAPEQLRAMVRELHRAGIEVILDVVFNHSAEGNHHGPQLSLRGFDNASFYRLHHPDASRDADVTGCGNSLDVRSPLTRRLILDALRVWARWYRVDGFRFDLAPVLGRGAPDGSFDTNSALLTEIASDPELSRLKLIAEPWDVGPGGYRLGGFPSNWAEWNDRFRDTVRAFWRGDGQLAELATRIAGSRDVLAQKGPLRGVNFVTAHDGFTLADVVSYEHKHNHANGEDNRDGHGHNLSRNWGVEGPSDDPQIQAARQRTRRNLAATLLLSQGVPMLLAGDELGHSQGGNNNAYCQDNATTWLDWQGAHEERDLRGFLRRLLQLRRDSPQLRRTHFPDHEELLWWHPEGRAMTPDDWHDSAGRAIGLMHCGAPSEGALFLLINGADSQVRFQMPEGLRVGLLVDTGDDAAAIAPPSELLTHWIDLSAHTLRLYAINSHNIAP